MKANQGMMDLTKGSIAKGLVQFTIPVIFGQILQQLYSIADAWVLGNYADNTAFAAVSSTNSLIFLMIGLFNGTAIGGGVVISRYFGAKDEKGVEMAIHTNVLFGLIASVLVTLAGLFLIPQMIKLMKVPEDVLPQVSAVFSDLFRGKCDSYSLQCIYINHACAGRQYSSTVLSGILIGCKCCTGSSFGCEVSSGRRGSCFCDGSFPGTQYAALPDADAEE